MYCAQIVRWSHIHLYKTTQIYKTQRTTPVCNNCRARVLDKFSHCYPVFSSTVFISLFYNYFFIFLCQCPLFVHFWIQEEECFLSKHNKTKQVSIHIHQKHCDCFLNMNLSPTSTFPSFPNNCNCVLWEK